MISAAQNVLKSCTILFGLDQTQWTSTSPVTDVRLRLAQESANDSCTYSVEHLPIVMTNRSQRGADAVGRLRAYHVALQPGCEALAPHPCSGGPLHKGVRRPGVRGRPTSLTKSIEAPGLRHRWTAMKTEEVRFRNNTPPPKCRHNEDIGRHEQDPPEINVFRRIAHHECGNFARAVCVASHLIYLEMLKLLCEQDTPCAFSFFGWLNIVSVSCGVAQPRIPARVYFLTVC